MEEVEHRQEENRFNFRLQKEKDHIKRFNFEKNIEREKRKMEWKKLNVLAKEKQNEERLQFMKFEEETIKRSLIELTIQQQLERERIMKTLNKVKKTDFKDQNTKKYIEKQIPDINVEDIFKPKHIENKEEEL